MAGEKVNLDDVMEDMKNIHSFTQEELEEIRILLEKLREYGIGRREYQLPSPLARQRIRTEKAEEPDPRTITLATSRR